MKIAVLGTGNVGQALGTRLAACSHTIVYGSRTPGSEKSRALAAETPGARVTSWHEAAAESEVVILATPWETAPQVIKACDGLAGKVLIDCINPLNADFSGLALGFDTSCAERIQQWAPEASVVKAFNSVSAATMRDPRYGDVAATLFYCGDDEAAKRITAELAEQLGFQPVDAGPLENARYLEPLAMLYIQLAMRGWGSNCAFQIVKREKPGP